MVPIVVLGGTGDVYLISALARAFKARHGREATIVIRRRYEAIPKMFGVNYLVDDEAVARGERDPAFHRDYDNVIADGRPFYPHPCFLRSSCRVDYMTAKAQVSQADMYKTILRLPPETPIDLPQLPRVTRNRGTVLVIPRSTSWPTEEPEFWQLLPRRLASAGWKVSLNADEWTLGYLFERCAESEWVIGPQCGVMSILVTGRFPCRKTFAIGNVDHNHANSFLPGMTFPYGYVTKFANEDHDVEEFKVGRTLDDHVRLVEMIASGTNAQRLWPHDPAPVLSISMPLMPGDFLDRMAVLAVKRERFEPPARAAIEREYQRHVEARNGADLPAAANGLYRKLLDLHRINFDLLERMVPDALDGAMAVSTHIDAVRINRERVRIKNEIDRVCRAPYTEVKSYYRDGATWAPLTSEPELPDRGEFQPTPQMRWSELPLNLPAPAPHGAPPSSARSPILVESDINGHNIVQFNGSFLAVPQTLGSLHLDRIDLRAYPRISIHGSREAARAAAATRR